MVNGIPLNNASYNNLLETLNETGLNEIKVDNKEYLTTKEILENQKDNQENILVYNSAPAIKEKLGSIITEINNVKIDNIDKLVEELSRYSPGDEVIIKTKSEEESFMEKTLILEEHPGKPGVAWLGIGFLNQERSGIVGKIVNTLSSFKKPHVYYEPKFDGISLFIYNLLWWLILISISVALINMLPVGIFDGGRFFYLTILGLTGSEKTARRFLAFSTQFFLFILLLLMILWVWSFIR